MTAYLEPAAPKRTKKAQKSKSIPDENIPLETKRMRRGRKIIRVVKRGSFQKKMADLYPGIKKEIKTRKKGNENEIERRKN
jgi:hypothetical protein